MRVLLRWLGIGLATLLALLIVAYGVVYALSERIMERTYPVAGISLAIPTGAEAVLEGQRLATIHGCYGACHGKGQGAVMFNQPLIARIVAPNLTAAVRRYSAAQLDAIIRHGLRPDGRSMLVMPSEVFAGLTDEDLAKILAFLESLPPVAGPGPSTALGPLGRIGLAVGKFKTSAQLIAATVPPPQAATPAAAPGRYLARTICAQCHGSGLRGDSNPDFTSPDLQIVAAYSLEQFSTLLRTGRPLGGAEVADDGTLRARAPDPPDGRRDSGAVCLPALPPANQRVIQ